MTRDHRHHNVDDDAVERAIDETVQSMTAVDAIEARSRVQSIARLAQTERETSVAERWMPRRLSPWMAAAGAAAIAALLLFMREPHVDPVRPAPAVSSRPTAQRAVPERAEPATRVIERVTATVHAPPVRRPSRLLARAVRNPVSSDPTGDDRLAAFLRAVQQLPPDVWARQDAAGPPVIHELTPAGPEPIAPLSIEQIPGSGWPETEPTATPSGEPR